MSEFLKRVDARTRLAGTNKVEVLLFALGVDQRTGRRETYGINVFKVREVMRTPEITSGPDMPHSVKGMVSLRGTLVPVVDLAEHIGIKPQTPRSIMIVTEYSGHTQGFLVEEVDIILRMDWSDMRSPPEMMTTHMGGLVTSVAELADHRLVMMLDVERILSDTHIAIDDSLKYDSITPLHLENNEITILFAEDSAVARRQIERTLSALGVNYIAANNGRIALNALEKIAATAASQGCQVRDLVHLVLTDIEMPEMDGYILTRTIKSDRRFAGIPVVMHSSLSSDSSHQLGRALGVDAYVSKFDAINLSQMLQKMLRLE